MAEAKLYITLFFTVFKKLYNNEDLISLLIELLPMR